MSLSNSSDAVLDQAVSVSVESKSSDSSTSPPEFVGSNETFLDDNHSPHSSRDSSRSRRGLLPKNAEVFEGVCVWFDSDRGFGFIRSESHPDDIFVHCWALAHPISKDTRVSFVLGFTNDRVCARRVYPLLQEDFTSDIDSICVERTDEPDLATSQAVTTTNSTALPDSSVVQTAARNCAVVPSSSVVSVNSTYAQIVGR